jgi:hypothetical protein
MRKPLLVGLIGLVALGACTTKKDATTSTTLPATSPTTASSNSTATTTGGSTQSTYTPVVDDRAPGVTADTIKIGITYVDFTKLKAIIGFDHGDYEKAYQAVIDDINAKGGVNGRKLEAVFAPVDPSVSDSGPAACTKLTQDDKVFLVMGYFQDDNVLCFVDTNQTIVIDGSQTAERLAKAKVAWYSTDPSDDTAADAVTALSDTMGEKVVVVGATGDQALYENSIKPVLAAKGVTPLEVAYIDTSSGDQNQGLADAEALAERFKADGAEQVLMIGSAVGGFFPNGLARTDFRPQLLFGDMNSAGAFTAGEGNDLSVMASALTAGAFDSGNLYEQLGSPTKECLAIETAAGLKLMPADDVPDGESQQIVSSLHACRDLALLMAILEKAGPDLNYGTFTTAGNNLGEIALPGFPDPMHYGPPPHADGDPVLYVYAWDETSKTMKLKS